MRPRVIMWTDLAGVDPGVLGGLIVERAEAVRVQTYKERWENDVHLFFAVSEGQADAVRGRRPKNMTTTLPGWLVTVIRERLRYLDTHWLGTDFVDVRMLELAGLLDLPVDDDYVIAMLAGLVASWSHEDHMEGDPVAWFRQDPALIERAFWRAFEIEGTSQVSLRVNGNSWSGTNWLTATQTMIKTGMIDRARVIDACLAALTGDLSPTASRWHSTTLTALKLSTAELADREPTVRRLLGRDAEATVTLGLSWVRRLDRAGLLDDEPTAIALRPAASARTKTAALAALKQLDIIRRRTPQADIVPAARAGLGHTHIDVQTAAAKLLLACGEPAVLQADAQLLEPSVRQAFGLTSPRADEALPIPVGAETPTTLRPVTEHDLAERLAALLEQPHQPLELELILDRLARGDHQDILRSLRKRATTILKRPDRPDGLARHLAQLVVSATTADIPEVEAPDGYVSRFLHSRLTEVREILTGRRPPAPLVAAPTDPAGWVDPAQLVFSLRSGAPPPRRDLLTAILRLHPDYRPAALSALNRAPLPDPELDAAVRHALGGGGATSEQVGDHGLWVAASRSRVPLGHDAAVIGAGLTDPGQGQPLTCKATFTVKLTTEKWLGRTNTERHPGYAISIDTRRQPPPVSDWRRPRWRASRRTGDPDQPTALASRDSDHDHPHESWPTWGALVWPHDAEHFMLGAVNTLFWSAQWANGVMDEYDTVLGALEQHPGRLGPITWAGIALGLSSSLVDSRVRAADTVLHLAAHDRGDAHQIAHGMADTADAAILTRWTESLRTIAAAGSPYLVMDILTGLLPHLARDRRGLHTLLDLLHQEQIRAGRPTDRRRPPPRLPVRIHRKQQSHQDRSSPASPVTCTLIEPRPAGVRQFRSLAGRKSCLRDRRRPGSSDSVMATASARLCGPGPVGRR